jgi:hypothetical protein
MSPEFDDWAPPLATATFPTADGDSWLDEPALIGDAPEPSCCPPIGLA